MWRVSKSILLLSCLIVGCRPFQGREEALSSLEETAALERSGVDVTDLDILKPALSYIPQYGEDGQKMMLWYYLGRIQYNRDELVDAAVSFERAEELAKRVGNPHFEGLINRSLAGVFNRTMNVREDSLHLRKAVNAFLVAGDTMHAAEAGLRLAAAYYNDRIWDKAHAQFMRVRTDVMKNDQLAFRYRLSLGSFLLDAPGKYGDASLALRLFEEARAFSTTFPVEKSIDYGYSLTLAGRETEGIRIWDSLERAQPERLMQLDYRRYCFLTRKKETEKALFYLE